jgi:hypothetical protein
MEPEVIALIAAASFGAVVAIAAFIRQMILSRDKLLNDEAQRRALAQEASELQKMREQMLSGKRYDLHYQVLGANKEAIIYLDNQIEELWQKKNKLIERYSQIILRESESIIDGRTSAEKKETCDRLKTNIDEQLKFYDNELERIQLRRTSLWDAQSIFQDKLVLQEAERNANLDRIYKQHTSLLEKVYVRHIDDEERVAVQSIGAGTSNFRDMIMAPIHFLLQYFNISSGINLSQAQVEQAARDDVAAMEREVNESQENDDDYNDDSADDLDVTRDERASTKRGLN